MLGRACERLSAQGSCYSAFINLSLRMRNELPDGIDLAARNRLRNLCRGGTASALLLLSATWVAAEPADRGAFVSRYCLSCHSRQGKAGGFVLEGVATDNPAAAPVVW
jgi:hypothetical protein